MSTPVDQPLNQPPSRSSFNSLDQDNDFPSDSSQSSHNSLPVISGINLFRSKKIIVKFVLLVSSLLVFGISLMFAIEHWDDNQHKSFSTWSPHPCRVISKEFQQNPLNDSQYRVIANVDGLDPPGEPVKAYYGSTANYTLSLPQANNALSKITNNTATTCYVSSETPPHISLLYIAPSQPSSGSLYIAWSATGVAAVMGIIQITFLSHLLHKCMVARIPTPSPQPTSPRQPKTSFLTSRQTRFICDKYAEEFRRADHSGDWVCSICLEEDPSESIIKGVRLPCHHAYHKRCIREWLSKGKSVCPLCNWNVKSLLQKSTASLEQSVGDVVCPSAVRETSSEDNTLEARNTSS